MLLTYDEGVQEGVQADWDAEVERACAVAEEKWDKPVGTLVRYHADWSVLGRKAALIEEVSECAADGRQASAEAAGADGPVDDLPTPSVVRPVPAWE